jgi:hypothetical protein
MIVSDEFKDLDDPGYIFRLIVSSSLRKAPTKV